MSDRPSSRSHSHSKHHSDSRSDSPSSDSGRSYSRRYSHSRSDRSYSSSKSSGRYSRHSRSRSRDSRGSSHGIGLPKIFITKLSPFVREEDIEEEFGHFGKIRKINLKKGYAFVEYFSKEDAKEAIRKMNKRHVFHQDEKIVVEEAIGKRRDRDRRRYSRSRDRYRTKDRNRYRDRRYYDDRDGDRYRYRRSEEYTRRRYRRTGPKSTDICFNCQGLGHWANECQEKPKYVIKYNY